MPSCPRPAHNGSERAESVERRYTNGLDAWQELSCVKSPNSPEPASLAFSLQIGRLGRLRCSLRRSTSHFKGSAQRKAQAVQGFPRVDRGSTGRLFRGMPTASVVKLGRRDVLWLSAKSLGLMGSFGGACEDGLRMCAAFRRRGFGQIQYSLRRCPDV
jgi:hypothetical protein